MSIPEKYLLDANVFIQAKRNYYPFDICPGYWDALCWHQKNGVILSIDKIWDELERGGDEIFTWAKDSFGKGSFVDSSISSEMYSSMVEWVQNQAHFKTAAKAEFAAVADGWLVALAKTEDYILVTQEVFDPLIQKKVPIPNVCEAFGVRYISTYDLLRNLGVVLNWHSPN